MVSSSEDQPLVDESGTPGDAPALRSIEEVLADPGTSYWLKAAIFSVSQRDPVDALNDALVLAALLEARMRSSLAIDEDGQ